MSVFALPQVASYVTGLPATAMGGAIPLVGFLQRADRFLADLDDGRTAELRGLLSLALSSGDFSHTRDRIVGDDRFLAQIAPAVLQDILREKGDAVLPALLGTSSYPGFQPAHLQAAFDEYGPMKRMEILAAVERQSDVWGRLLATDHVPMEMGALSHSGGDFDAVMQLLLAQGLSYRWARTPPPEGDPLLVTVLSRGGKPNEPPNVYALQYSAGLHKRGLRLHQIPKPFVSTAFPPEAREALTGRFDLHFMTPTAARIEETFTPAVAAQLRRGAFVVYDPKSFSQTGETMDEWVEEVLSEAVRKDVATAFVAGFTGAKTVYGEPRDLPSLPEEGVHGLHLGIGTTDILRGLQLASVLTGVPESQATRMMVGGAEVHTFKGLSFPRPVVVDVYSDPALRKVQTLVAIYKNVFSGINGRDLFNWIFRRLDEQRDEDTADLIREAEGYYGQLVAQSLEELRRILVEVEGISPEKVHILPPSEMDARESWRVRDMGLLVNLIRNLFFGSHVDGAVNPAYLRHAVREWREKIGEVFATRNPVAGATVAATADALRYFLVSNPSELMPVVKGTGERITFEGLTTALTLDRRLSPGEMQRLPDRVKDYVAEARQTRHPQVLPPEVRLRLIQLASLLAKMLAGQIPTTDEAGALLDRLVTADELKDTVRWRGTLTVDLFVEAVGALQKYLDLGRKLIRSYGEQHAVLSREMLRHLDVMVATMGRLAEVVREADRRQPLQIPQLRMLVHALKSLITDGDRIYLGEDLDDVMKDLRDRTRLIFDYLQEKTPRPYPTGYNRYLPPPDEGGSTPPA